MESATARPLNGHYMSSNPPHYTQARQQIGYDDFEIRTPRPSDDTSLRLHDHEQQRRKEAEHDRYNLFTRTTPSHYEGYQSQSGGQLGSIVPAENTLRRKTPSGVLDNGYHGSPRDITTMRHMLLPSYQLNTPTAAPARCVQMDSILHQAPARSPLPPNPYGQTVPSVIQPSLQQLGPTASGVGGRGPYGPYWQDGTYVPYRPTAIRDPRFLGEADQGSNAVSSHRQSQQEQASWQHGPAPWVGRVTLSNRPDASMHQTHGSLHPAFPIRSSVTSHSYYHDCPNVESIRSRRTSGTHLDTTPVHISQAPDFGPTSTNAQQRERTFNWALQIYRELLGYHHQLRKSSQQNRQVYDQSASTRPSFFPKPPPSSTGHYPNSPRIQTGSILNSALSFKGVQNDDDVPATSIVGSNCALYCTPKPPHNNALEAALNGVPSHDHAHQQTNPFQHSSSHHQKAWSQEMPQSTDDLRTLRQPSGTASTYSLSPLIQSDESSQDRAMSALAILSSICSQTRWQWVDGIHLSGCLAYALGDFQKAFRWFTKVLNLDPRHLEATSNLAATMLALGDRQEAEQCWIKVVRLAPNHFEALEHLVGLLCNDSRSREAIKIIEYVEHSLRLGSNNDMFKNSERHNEASSMTSRASGLSDCPDAILHDFDVHDILRRKPQELHGSSEPGFGSSGYAIPGSDNGRLLALVHAKGNMLYSLKDNAGAAKAFEDAVLIATGRKFGGIQGLIKNVLAVISANTPSSTRQECLPDQSTDPVLLRPEQAVQTARLCFPHVGELPGLQQLPGESHGLAKKAAISTTSNSLLSLAKIFQDGMSTLSRDSETSQLVTGVRDILALYYLSLSLQPSPSTANNVGILLAGIQQSAPPAKDMVHHYHIKLELPGIVPGSGVALALAYYNYGLLLDSRHAHLYTNLGSLLKDIGQLDAAIEMYKRAVQCDGKFDIALANLANAVKDKGRIREAIDYYKRAVDVSPEFAEAVCGLANALNSTCSWQSRGGVLYDCGQRDRWHVDSKGMLLDATQPGVYSSGWMKRAIDTVEKQLADGELWGRNSLAPTLRDEMVQQLTVLDDDEGAAERSIKLKEVLTDWSGQRWEGARLTRLVERVTRRISWQWYQDKHVHGKEKPASSYVRPQLPTALTVPSAPTVLPFHTFTCPVSAQQVRLISQRNGNRISASVLRMAWLPMQVYYPPAPPRPCLKVGYVSSDFNNHPLAHLMQSVFGLHDGNRVEAHCYATSASDNSVHRQQIEVESHSFHDVSSWSTERLVNQIVQDGIHILINLNGYTRGARNEVFAARPAPIQMSFMGFAGTLGAEWCDYLLADETAVPLSTLRPWRGNVDVEDQMVDKNSASAQDDWVYGENIIFCRDTFFCCDHKQSAPDSHEKKLTWQEEQKRRWRMRKELFPTLADDVVIFGNFNQLYKIDPTTFRTWLRILARVPNSILWLLRFPDLGEPNLLRTAQQWAGSEVASRVIFTDVAPKHLHISRARVCDLFLDTPECNAHTTAADVLWSGTPLLTFPRYTYKMCSRMAASILKGALPKSQPERAQAERDLIASSEEEYEDMAVRLGAGLCYAKVKKGKDLGRGEGRLMELRKMLTEARWTSALFDTKRWVSDLEDAYQEAWRRWVTGEGGDIWLDRVPRGAGAGVPIVA